MKASLEQVEKTAREVGISKHQAQALLERLSDELSASDEGEKAPPVKKQFVLLVSDPLGFLAGHDFAGWVLQIPESEHPATTCERIHRAAYDFNASKKGRLLPVQTIGEACENIPARFFKEADVWVKTKTPVIVVVTNNEIPKVEKLTSGADELTANPKAVGIATALRRLANENGASVEIKTGSGKIITVEPDSLPKIEINLQ